MLFSRELDVLLATRGAGAEMVYVGAGAAKVLREATNKKYILRQVKGSQKWLPPVFKQTELLQDLTELHSLLLPQLRHDLVRLVVPRGWAVDHTEHASCEKRRYDDAILALSISKNLQ